jgi:hypothetical protein
MGVVKMGDKNNSRNEAKRNDGLFRPEGAERNSPGQSEAPPWVTNPSQKTSRPVRARQVAS